MKAKALMVQGTGSHVGKSLLVCGLGRILREDGFRVAPFKAQNMALNSFVTRKGGEMGRAQVAQAEACCIEPEVEMNPILLKPMGERLCQVVLMGKPVGNMTAQEYYAFKSTTWPSIVEAYEKLAQRYEVILIEGAGSPAEPNLKEHDIVNMKVAMMVRAPVLLVGDIDKGGVFASFIGTLKLLEPKERRLIRGLVINKFRGDKSLLEKGLEMIEAQSRKKVVGVVPYLEHLRIDEEDSVALDTINRRPGSYDLEVAVIRLPSISNFSDFEALRSEPGVYVRYVGLDGALGRPDLIIIPGSKSTIADLRAMAKAGLAEEMKTLTREGTILIGLCGGFQMLGRAIHDPDHIESREALEQGLGLLEVETTFSPHKVTHQVLAEALGKAEWLRGCGPLKGYEIHMGQTFLLPGAKPLFKIFQRSGKATSLMDGAVNLDGNVLGTYIHGIFDNDLLRTNLLHYLRRRRGLPSGPTSRPYDKEAQYRRLAAHLRGNLDMSYIYSLLRLKGS